MPKFLAILFIITSLFSSSMVMANDAQSNSLPDAKQLIQTALESWRGKSSFSQVRMIVHRPEWQRESVMQGWTQDMDKSLIRFLEPARDAGNATLKLDQKMWLFTPKLNRVTQLPSSMMSQSWMGSDFSYNDLAKSDQILTDYTASILDVKSAANGLKIYHIQLIPKANAPVVWGKEVLRIREDGLLLSETFYDQNQKKVKSLYTLTEATLNKKPYPVKMRMVTYTKTDEWTEIITEKLWLDLTLPPSLFTETFLKSPRPWTPNSPSELIHNTRPVEEDLP